MNLVDRVKNIILTPKTEWPVIAGESPNVGQIITGYVLPLALIPTIGNVIGWGFVGMGFRTSLMFGIAQGLVAFVGAILTVYVSAFVIDFLAPNFGSEKDLGRSMQLVAYSMTPGWVAGILYVFPALGVISLIAHLYGLYLLFLGLPVLKKTPQDKVVTYLVIAIIVLIVLYMVIGAILAAIFLGLFGLSAAGMMGM